MPDIPHLLLAAGNSQRMGQPKQLLTWGDKTLIEHQVQTRLQTNQNVAVILGSQAELIIPFIKKFPISIFINKDWKKGMGNSLSYGIKKLIEKNPDIDAVLISLLDQPLITTEHLEKIHNLFQTKKKQIIASQSASGWTGVPALFDKFYFEELTKLNREQGAKKIIQKHQHFVKSIATNSLLDDMDTPEAYQSLLNEYFRR